MNGHSVFPLHIQVGMALVVNNSLLHRAKEIIRLWTAALPEISAGRALSGFDYIHIGHDLVALAAARFDGDISFVSSPLASRRLHDGNVTRPVEGWGERQDVIVATRDALTTDYMAKEMFLRDFSKHVISKAAFNSEEQRSHLFANYARWASIFERRRLLIQEQNLFKRLPLFYKNIVNGAYAARLSQGLGVKSLAKDALVSALGSPDIDQ